MLYPNGQRAITSPGTRRAGSLAASGTTAYSGIGGARFNRYVSGTYNKVTGAVPSGYGGRAYVFAVKSGGLAAFTGLSLATGATGGLGLPGTGSTSITFTVADAAGELISSGTGSASMTFTVANLLLTASLNGTGSSTITLNTNTPLLGAQASAIGNGTFSITGTMTPYAIGSMSGSTVDTSTIVNANIVSVNGYSVTGNGQTGTEWGPV